MGFFTNYDKTNTQLLASNLLQQVTYHNDAGNTEINVLFNVTPENVDNYVQQIGKLGVFTEDLTPRPGDSFTDSDSRLWYVESFVQQKGSMIFVNCYSNNEAVYKE